MNPQHPKRVILLQDPQTAINKYNHDNNNNNKEYNNNNNSEHKDKNNNQNNTKSMNQQHPKRVILLQYPQAAINKYNHDNNNNNNQYNYNNNSEHKMNFKLMPTEDNKPMEEKNKLNENEDKSNIENAHFTSNSNSSKSSKHFPKSTNSRSRSRSRDRNSNSNSNRRRSETNNNNINGCLWRGQLMELHRHLDECIENTIQCEYFNYGCTANKRNDQDLHNKNFETKHLELKMKALERMLKDKSEEIQYLRFEMERTHCDRERWRRRFFAMKNQDRCHHCNIIGHWSRDCFVVGRDFRI